MSKLKVRRQQNLKAFRDCRDAIYARWPKTAGKIPFTGRESSEQMWKLGQKRIKELDEMNNQLLKQAAKDVELGKVMDNIPRGKAEKWLKWLVDPPARAIKGLGIHPLSSRYKAFRNLFETTRKRAFDKVKEQGLGKMLTPDFHREYMRVLYNPEYVSHSPAANIMGKAQKKINDQIHELWTERGGIMGYLEEFAVPIKHNASKVLKLGKPAWTILANDTLDKKRIMDQLVISTPEEWDQMLSIVYDGISTGWKKVPATGTVKRKVYRKLGNRFQDNRLFHFDGADARMRYDKAAGNGTDYYSYSSLYSDMMAKQLAKLDLLGPSADAHFARLLARAEAESLATGKESPWIFKAKNAYDDFSGKLDSPIGDTSGLKWFQRAKDMQVVSKLGKAIIASISDSGFMWSARKLRKADGLKTVIGGMKNMVSNEDWDALARLGYGAAHERDAILRNYRFNPDMQDNWTGKAADNVLKWTGLIRWTEGNKLRMKKDVALDITRDTLGKKTLAEVPEHTRRILNQYGLTDYDVLRLGRAERVDLGGGLKLIDMDKLDKADYMNFMATIESEAAFGLPDMSSTIKGALNFGTNRNTFEGQVLRVVTQLKSFPTAVVGILARGSDLPAKEMMAYYGHLGVSLTVLGTISVQASRAIMGKELLDWNDPMLWVHGFAKSGAGSLPADILQAAGYPSGPHNYLLGPSVADAFKLLQIGVKIPGKPRKAAGDLVKFASSYVPYTQMLGVSLAYERAFQATVEQWINPNAKAGYARTEKKLKKETNAGMWWRKGEVLPEIFGD